jgi:hypothetical protein
MKKTTLLSTLPAFTLVCALSACGGGGGDDPGSSGGGSNPETASVAQCFKAPTAAKNYEVLTTDSDYPNATAAIQIRLAPVIFMGQAATETGFTFSNPDSTTVTLIGYSAITNNKSCEIAEKYPNETNVFVYPIQNCTPFNIKPGDSFDFPGFTDSNDLHSYAGSHTTFVGFESITMNGKTFSNACRFRGTSDYDTEDYWVASEYGTIKSNTVRADGSTASVTFSRDR